MPELIPISPKSRPVLDPGFVPASLWNREFRSLVSRSGRAQKVAIALERSDGSVSVRRAELLPHEGAGVALNQRYIERMVKMLLWQKGGYKITISGPAEIAGFVKAVYAPAGKRAFDYDFMGTRVYGKPMVVEHTTYDRAPEEKETGAELGRNLDGCRIGFDLGASDRKCSAVIDGEPVHTEEVAWDPSVQKDPQYHFDGINDSLERAAAKLPRVDAIGGSSAGVYVNNEVRVASLFRGVPPELFETRIRRIFFELQAVWGGIPFEVVNDGEVTALAGSMALNDNAVLGIAMGSSLAAGYVNPQGNITNWLNELAFVPVDYREQGPLDEWSRDEGVGVQYFSQQAVSRLLPAAGIDVPKDMPFPVRLVEVQKLMAAGDARARKIYETIGAYLGYTIPHYSDFYEVRNLLVLGRVTTGEGGDLIIATAKKILAEEFPEIGEKVRFHTPSEKEKRHGQAVVAASLPRLRK
jgi:predicted NBD/HSP70 family sugar kinase